MFESESRFLQLCHRHETTVT